MIDSSDLAEALDALCKLPRARSKATRKELISRAMARLEVLKRRIQESEDDDEENDPNVSNVLRSGD